MEAISGYERGDRGRHTIYAQRIIVKSYGSKVKHFNNFILRVELEDSRSSFLNIVSLSLTYFLRLLYFLTTWM